MQIVFLASDEQRVMPLMQAGTDQFGLKSVASLLSVIRLSWIFIYQISCGCLSLNQICRLSGEHLCSVLRESKHHKSLCLESVQSRATVMVKGV